MFEKYDDRARRVVFFARYEASRFGSPAIDTEHLLLGVLWEDIKLVERLWPDPKTRASIRLWIEEEAPRRERTPMNIDLPFSREARDALAFATQGADDLGDRWIEPRHILLGLSRIEGSLAARILTGSGADIAPLREQRIIRESLDEARKELMTVCVPVPGPLRLASELSSAIYAGAQEAVALSHGWLGPEHVLLGFLRDEESLAARILGEHGLTLESLRERLARERR